MSQVAVQILGRDDQECNNNQYEITARFASLVMLYLTELYHRVDRNDPNLSLEKKKH